METVDLVLTIAVIIALMTGIILNIQILIGYIEIIKNRVTLGPSDKVHLTKALVNTSMHLLMAAQCTICVFWPYLLITDYALAWNAMINIFLTFYNYWLMVVLCVYYCTNITNCGHHCFVWLKRSLSSYLLHILLVSGLVSVAISCPTFWFSNINPARNSTYQTIVIQATIIPDVTYRTALSILGCFLPLTIAFVSTTITSWSLVSHIWRMKQNNRGLTFSKFQPQINATRTMILFLLICVTYNVAQMIFIAKLSSSSNTIVIISWFIAATYIILEAIIIIHSSSKLRSTLLGKFFNRKRRNNEAET